MNILIIHQHFKTPVDGGALRSYFLAKALVEKGHKVQVVTGTNDKAFYQKDVDGIEVHYLPVAYSNYFSFWKRVYSFIKFVFSFIWRSKKFSQADICYAISVPLTVGLAANWMLKKYKVPYFFEVGDLWPDAAIELDVIENKFLKKLLWSLERKIYSHARAIVALSPSIKDAIEKKISGKEIHVIPNMADTEFFQPEVKDPVSEPKFQVKDKFVISYLGAMGFANGLEFLLATASECQKQDLQIQFILAGDGVEKQNLQQKAESLKLNNTSFHGFQNREGIKELMNATDAVFVCYRHAAILETGSPNKFFDGLAAGKLILINFGGWIKKEIEESECGFYIDPEKPTDIIPIIKSILDSGKLHDYQKRSRQLAEQKFSRQKLTNEWVNVLTRSNT